MLTLVAIVHVLIALLLVIFVLLQDSKGGAMGGALTGGGANTVFGSAGAGNFLTKVTKWLAILFAVTCVGLVYMTSTQKKSVLDDLAPATVPTSTETIDTSGATATPSKTDPTQKDEKAAAATPGEDKDMEPAAPESKPLEQGEEAK